MPDIEEVVTAGAAVGAGIGARKLTDLIWKRATGAEPPEDPTDKSTSWGEAIAWTVMVGVVVGLMRLVARRGARAVVS
jgi:hypothetical protein